MGAFNEMGAFDDQEFVLLPEHIKLLRAANVTWYEIETGAPAIDGKRPYGESGVARHIIEMMGWQPDPDDVTRREDRQDRENALRLHRDTETALQIVLSTGSFEPGVYVSSWHGRVWKRKDQTGDD